MHVQPSIETLISKVVERARRIDEADRTSAPGAQRAIELADELCGEIVALRWSLLQDFQRQFGRAVVIEDREPSKKRSSGTMPELVRGPGYHSND